MPLAFDPHAAIFSVGQVAEMLGVQPALVRRLDTEQVVQPQRSAGGQRRYSQREIERVEHAVAMADQGHNLTGIRRILALEAQLADLQAQLEALRAGGRR